MKRDDTLWKAILEDLFDDFLRFFYPNADEIFDMNRGFEFLDKELEELFPETETESIRYVDKLVKVWLTTGQEEWILIHIEVQGQSKKNFPERMFVYYYRIRDKYKRKIAAWAILSDRNKSFNPTFFEESFLGTTNTYRFNTYKIINQDENLLKASDNPFAILILTVLLALKKTSQNELELVDLKMDLVKHLLLRQISKEKIRALMNFLKYYVRFNEENTLIFERKFEQFTGKTYPMGIEQFLLHQAKTEGLKIGEQKGLERGIEKGIEKGLLKEKKEVIKMGYINGLEISMIAKLVQLPDSEVKAILIEMGLLP